jgi:F-box and leucine-rich repeat protein GRR1
MARCSLANQIEHKRTSTTEIDPQPLPTIDSVLNPSTLYLRRANITDLGLSELVRQYPSLRKIRLHYCSLITDASVIAIGEHCSRLLELDLTGCSELTDVAVQGLCKLTQLNALALSQMQITDQSLFDIGRSAFHHSLNEINLRKCTQITDDGFLFLVQHCPNLKTIGFIQCPKLTERSRHTLNQQTHRYSYLVYNIPI